MKKKRKIMVWKKEEYVVVAVVAVVVVAVVVVVVVVVVVLCVRCWALVLCGCHPCACSYTHRSFCIAEMSYELQTLILLLSSQSTKSRSLPCGAQNSTGRSPDIPKIRENVKISEIKFSLSNQ